MSGQKRKGTIVVIGEGVKDSAGAKVLLKAFEQLKANLKGNNFWIATQEQRVS